MRGFGGEAPKKEDLSRRAEKSCTVLGAYKQMGIRLVNFLIRGLILYHLDKQTDILPKNA